jgi:hypothetical protein
MNMTSTKENTLLTFLMYLDDLEDVYLAEQLLVDFWRIFALAAPKRFRLERWCSNMAWQIKLDPAAEKELIKLGPRGTKHVLTFLFERVAQSDDPGSVGEALTLSEARS